VCVWLAADPAVLARRLAADPAPRPPLTELDPERELALLARRRGPHFARLAAITVDTGAWNPKEIAREIEGELRMRGAI
jgi:shikimate kinase